VLELKRSKCEKRIFSAIPTGEQDAFQWDDVDVNFSHLDLFSSNTQTPPSAGWRVESQHSTKLYMKF
jgi:hypothetical protein